MTKLAPKQKCRHSGKEVRHLYLKDVEGGGYRCSCGAIVQTYKKGFGYDAFIKTHNIPDETVEERAARERKLAMSSKVTDLELMYRKTEKDALKVATAMMIARETAGISIVEFVTRTIYDGQNFFVVSDYKE